jgi:hypothetical protein
MALIRRLSAPKIRGPDTINSIRNDDVGMFTIAEIAMEDAGVSLPAHLVAGAPAWTDQGSWCPGAPDAALRCLAPFATWEPRSSCHGFCSMSALSASG